jgi:hypothetical protein
MQNEQHLHPDDDHQLIRCLLIAIIGHPLIGH